MKPVRRGGLAPQGWIGLTELRGGGVGGLMDRLPQRVDGTASASPAPQYERLKGPTTGSPSRVRRSLST